MEYLNQIGAAAKKAAKTIRKLRTDERNQIILKTAEALRESAEEIMAANRTDVANARKSGMTEAMVDRLALSEKTIAGIAEGLEKVAALDDPLGDFVQMKTLPNGLAVGQKRVAIGVIAMIYESRPNVTADAFGLCIKAGSCVILRGGSEAIHSNMALVKVFRDVLQKLAVPEAAVTLIEDTSRETATALMRLNEYIDLLIPRGGAGLIKSVVQNSTVPVIETGTGNCHIYIDEWADQEKAIPIVVNAKTQRPGVCNACETVLIHEAIAEEILPPLCDALRKSQVELRGDVRTCTVVREVTPAVEADWETEYGDLILAVKIVRSIEEAMAHIDKYSSGHSESIITESYTNGQMFLNEVDSAAVYVNASTRFTDGFEFGLGAEIGISTQKLHARGPMGLREMTTTKYIIYGSGQIRA